jgi:hypothetical protein
LIIFALTRKAADKAIERLTSAVREALRQDERAPRKSGHSELIRLQSASARVADGESIETVAKELSLDCDVLRRWLKRR